MQLRKIFKGSQIFFLLSYSLTVIGYWIIYLMALLDYDFRLIEIKLYYDEFPIGYLNMIILLVIIKSFLILCQATPLITLLTQDLVYFMWTTRKYRNRYFMEHKSRILVRHVMILFSLILMSFFIYIVLLLFACQLDPGTYPVHKFIYYYAKREQVQPLIDDSVCRGILEVFD